MANLKTNITKPEPSFPSRRLYRSKTDKVIAGVAGGLGEYLQIDPTLIRLIFILVTIFGGSGIIIYLALWLIMPYQMNRDSKVGDFEGSIDDVKIKARKVANEIKINSHRRDSRVWWGILIIVAGFLFLFNNFGFFTIFEFSRIWPLILVIFGLAILLKR